MYRPWTRRDVGIELEVRTVTTSGAGLTAHEIANAARDGLREVGEAHLLNEHRIGQWFNSNGQTWDIKRDGSCGWEVVSPAIRLDDQGHHPALREVTKRVQRLRPRIDRNCGYHVHVACPDYTWDDLRRLMILWARYEPMFFEMCPPSRATNHYCLPMRSASWMDTGSGNWWTHAGRAIQQLNQRQFEQHARSLGKYCGLNVSKWHLTGRVEFRLAAGTMDYTKIRRWAMLMASLVERVKHPNGPKISRPVSGLRAAELSTLYVCKALGLTWSPWGGPVPEESHELMQWVHERRTKFHPNAKRGWQDATR